MEKWMLNEGCFSIRTGCIISCLLQITIAVAVWGSLKYLRPMLQVFNFILLAYILVGGVVGFYGVITRNEFIMWIYLLHLGSCATITLLLTLDYSGIIFILPKPPMSPTTPIVPPLVEKIHKMETSMSQSLGNMIPGYSTSYVE